MDVWNIAEQKIVHHVVSRGRTGVGDSGAFSPNGQLFAMDIGDGSIRIFNLATGAEMLRLSLTSEPSHIRFHPDGRSWPSAAYPEVDRGRDLKTRSVLHRFDHPQGILSVCLASGRRAPGGGMLRSLRLHLGSGSEELLHVLKGHKEVVHHVNFHPTQNFAVSHSWDGTTHVWSLADGSSLLAVEGYATRFAANGRRLAFRNGLNLGLWKLPNGPSARHCTVNGTEPKTSEASRSVRTGISWPLELCMIVELACGI